MFDEMSKSNSFFFFLIIPLVLSCLDQLRFIECYKQIIVHCADDLFFYWVSVFKGSFFLFVPKLCLVGEKMLD